MDVFGGGLEVHPAGEVETEESLAVDTHGRRIHVEWDPASPVTAEHRPYTKSLYISVKFLVWWFEI